MCIICASPAGVRQPSYKTIETMFFNNPHGAGYMYARDGKVTIHKGFMDFDDFVSALKSEHFTAKDSVVYHFRISTQAGVNPEMTHPFPLSNRLEYMKALDVECGFGIAHNGVIPLTTDKRQKEYSDTALFVAKYLSKMIQGSEDIKDPTYLGYIRMLIQSKMAILDGNGYIATIGNFINDRGLLFSNNSYLPFYGIE